MLHISPLCFSLRDLSVRPKEAKSSLFHPWRNQDPSKQDGLSKLISQALLFPSAFPPSPSYVPVEQAPNWYKTHGPQNFQGVLGQDACSVISWWGHCELTMRSLCGHIEVWQLLIHLVQTLVLTLGSFPKVHGLREATTIIICQRSVGLSHLQHSHLLSCGHLLPVIYQPVTSLLVSLNNGDFFFKPAGFDWKGLNLLKTG